MPRNPTWNCLDAIGQALCRLLHTFSEPQILLPNKAWNPEMGSGRNSLSPEHQRHRCQVALIHYREPFDILHLAQSSCAFPSEVLPPRLCARLWSTWKSPHRSFARQCWLLQYRSASLFQSKRRCSGLNSRCSSFLSKIPAKRPCSISARILRWLSASVPCCTERR